MRPKRSRTTVWLVVAACLLVAGVSTWQSGRRDDPPVQARPGKGGEVAVLQQQVIALRSRLAALPADANPRTRRRLIEDALVRQRTLMRLRGATVEPDTAALAEWQGLLEDALAAEQEYMSRGMEADAMNLWREGKTAAAVEKVREALRLQRAINRDGPPRHVKNLAREAQLQQQIEGWVAEPLLAATRRAWAEARVAADTGRWADAAQLYTEAREARKRLNAQFPGSRYEDLAAEKAIDAESRTLRAGRVEAELGQYLVQAAQAAAAGRWEEGDRLYDLAAAQQKIINTEFPQSRLYSVEQLERIETERQALRLTPRLAGIRRLDERIAGHLRRRELAQARRLVPQAVAAVKQAASELPKAWGLDEELSLRLLCLGWRIDDFEQIQELTYELLSALPGGEKQAMLRTELPQEIYDFLMSDNPSSRTGPELPVDSVTYAEAMEFCRRLGWIMGTAVRLPTGQECQQVAGMPEFASLAGGLDEWLAGANVESAEAPLRGRDGSVRHVSRRERAPTTGFRVVVAVDLENAAKK